MRIYSLHFIPMAAYEIKEKSLHYGPSEIIHIEDIDRGKLLVGRYDKWISCGPVEKYFLFWKVGNSHHGLEKDESQAINFNAGSSQGLIFFYGFINDEKVDKVELSLGNGEVYSEMKNFEDIFLILAETDEETASQLDLREFKAYDKKGKVIYEFKFY